MYTITNRLIDVTEITVDSKVVPCTWTLSTVNGQPILAETETHSTSPQRTQTVIIMW